MSYFFVDLRRVVLFVRVSYFFVSYFFVDLCVLFLCGSFFFFFLVLDGVVGVIGGAVWAIVFAW